MISDNERREVAARLRDANHHSCSPGCELRYALDDCYDCIGNGCAGCHRDAFDRLADLIYPDTITDTTKSPDVTTKCDRDALLALADELERCAGYFSLDFDVDEPLRDLLNEASEDFAGCANRIREALGVEP